jgi:hypothetical protein
MSFTHIARIRTAPVFIALILIATAIPFRFRQPVWFSLSYEIRAADVLLNVLLFFPLGMTLARSGLARAGAYAMLLSIGIETLQLFLPFRHSSPVDVVSNVTGASLGTLLAAKCKFRFDVVDLGSPVTRALFGGSLLGLFISDPFWGMRPRFLLPAAALSGVILSGALLSIKVPKARLIRWILAGAVGFGGGLVVLARAPNGQLAASALLLSMAGGLTMAFACEDPPNACEP